MTRRRIAPVLVLAALAALGVAAVVAWRLQRAAGPADASRTATLAPVDPHPFDWPARVTLVAGDGHPGLRDGPGAQARFADPYGLVRDAHGDLLVADAGDNDRIRVVHADGSVATLAGGAEGFRDGPAAEARFHAPSGLAVDRAGNVIVADTGNHAIRRIAPDGTVTTLAGDGTPGDRDGVGSAARFDGPMAVAVDAAGRVLVADAYNDRIRAITPDGRVTTLAGGPHPGDADGPGASARFDTPCAIAVDARGFVWVADTRNDALRVIDRAGWVTTPLRLAPDDDRPLLHRPVGLATSADGALVVGTLDGAVLEVSPGGAVHALVRPDAQRLVRPTGLVAGPGKQVVVADAGATRLHALVPRAGAGAGDDAPVFDGPRGPAPDRPLPATAHRWPVRPQLAWHEVVGTVGEVRGDGAGEQRDHLHAGLDVRGDVGQAVVAIADGEVASPIGSWGYGRLDENLPLGELGYVHLRVGRDAQGRILDPARFVALHDDQGRLERVRVRRGTRFAAGDVLGTINPMAHVHLALGVPGFAANPLVLGFQGLRDTTPPVIAAVELHDATGQRLLAQEQGRLVLPRADLELVVDAWDQVDDNLPRRRLGLYTLGYLLLQPDGRPLPGFETPREAIRFDTLPADPDAAKLAYADSSGITVHGAKETHFRYRLAGAPRTGPLATGPWSTTSLAPGDYLLRIVAKDWSGNEAVRGRDLAIRVR